MKELWRKKSVKAALAAIVIMVVLGIVGISAQSSQRRRDYNGHVEAAEKYLSELDYEQAIAEYSLALEIEPDSKEVLDALEDVYLAYAQDYGDREEYESAIAVLERGYAQTERESLLQKAEEFASLQAQREVAEQERFLAEDVERQRLLAEALEREEQQAETEGMEEEPETPEEEAVSETPAPTKTPEASPTPSSAPETTPSTVGDSEKLAAYQAKAAEFAFSVQTEMYGSNETFPFIDARDRFRTQAEFYQYFNSGSIPQSEWGIYVGAVNTSVLSETDTQCRILVTDMVYNCGASATGHIRYFEFAIDKATGQGTVEDFYWDLVEVGEDEDPPGTVYERGTSDIYGCKGRTFDFNAG